MSKLNKYIIIGILVIALFFAIKAIIDLKKEVTRISDNFEIEMLKLNKELQLTKSELKTLYPSIDSLSKKLDIKLKNIEHIVQIEYRYYDTTITHSKTVYDSINEKLTFIAPRKCGQIEGYVQKRDVVITKDTYNDDFTLFLYKEKPRLLKIGNFIDWRQPWRKYTHTAKFYSECKQDTINITRDIKMIKK